MRLKCVAKIATVYFQSQETSVIETGFLAHTQAEGRTYTDGGFFNFFGKDVCVCVELFTLFQ